MSTDIFGTDQPAQPNSEPTVAATPATQTSSNSNPFGDHLSAIKNERGEVKYDTVEDALRGAAHAQVKIAEDTARMQTLQQELITAREENAKLKGALNVADLIKPQTPTPVGESSPATPQGLSEEETRRLIVEENARQSIEAQKKRNITTVVDKLKAVHGANAGEVFYKAAAAKNMSNDQMNELAATSPEAALALLEGVPVDNLNPTQTSVTTPVTPPPAPSGGPVAKGEKSVLVGATSQDLKSEWARHKEAVYNKYGVSA